MKIYTTIKNHLTFLFPALIFEKRTYSFINSGLNCSDAQKAFKELGSVGRRISECPALIQPNDEDLFDVSKQENTRNFIARDFFRLKNTVTNCINCAGNSFKKSCCTHCGTNYNEPKPESRVNDDMDIYEEFQDGTRIKISSTPYKNSFAIFQPLNQSSEISPN